MSADDVTGNSGFEEYRLRVAGTTIDNKTLLSTDYFNSFNEVVMLLGIVGEVPEVLDDIKAWRFRTYAEHFRDSGLAFGALAIEAYPCAPPLTREQFEALIRELRVAVEEAQRNLQDATTAEERDKLQDDATRYARHLQHLIAVGSSIIHGVDSRVDQNEIDKLF